jgi:hypothetical protein
MQEIARVTASSWDPRNPPAGCLDPRNHDGWSPDLAASGPVHLTATFAEPIRTDATPFLTTQLNFGFGKSLVPGLIELFVITGTDDGTNLPPDIVTALESAEGQRPAEVKILQGTLTRELERYRANEAAALAYLAVGESPRDPKLPPAEHAAWAQVAAILLNLSETVTRN